MLVIDRWEGEEIKRRKGWLLLYGRRKVGKSFLLRRLTKWDVYATITRSRAALVDGELRPVEEAIRLVVKVLSSGGKAVIDEFQRLNDAHWERLAEVHPSGRLFLAGSSLGIVRKVFDRRSPLLGLVEPFRLDIISYSDMLANLRPKDREGFIWATLMRDPWVIPLASDEDPVRFLVDRSFGLFMSAQGLVGEVFSEEERVLTSLYDSILLLMGEGVWSAREMAGILSSRGLLSGGTAAVTGILSRLESMGLAMKIPLWKSGRAKYLYRHRSPLLSVLYYMEAKFGVSDGYPPEEGAVRSILGREVQLSVGEMLARREGARLAYHVSPASDVDAVLLKRKRVIAGYEIKLGPISREEAEKAVRRMRELGVPYTGLVSLTERPPDVGDESLGPDDLVELSITLKSSPLPHGAEFSSDARTI
ncbi:MAG: ATP-binding protein [Candidatus Korarchaeota archaeon]|nr:ATP-binding protein [Candidatus Korarchaeota archaeon]